MFGYQQTANGLCLTVFVSSGSVRRPPKEIAVHRLCAYCAVTEQIWRTLQTQRPTRLTHIGQQRRLYPERLSSSWVLHLQARAWLR